MSTLLSLTKSFLLLLLALFRYLFYRVITSFLTGIVLLFVAVLMFVTFHQAYMPVVSHVKPVHLQFRSECKDPSAGLCSYPEASVFFTSKNKANDKRMLMRGQSYKVFLDIEMPSSPTNEKLGMFMVNLKFLSAKGTVLKSSSRSCMLHYESSLVRFFRTIFFSLPLTLGLTEEKQKVQINFFEDYIDDSYNPAVQAKVVIMTRQVEIYSSTLRLQASFTGLRYVIFNWPLLFSFIAVLVNFVIITLIFSACINQLYSSSLTTSNTQCNTQQQTMQLQRNISSQQNVITASSSSTSPATLTNDNQQQTCDQQITPLLVEDETSGNSTPTPNGPLLSSQEQNQPPQTNGIIPSGSGLSKPKNRQTKQISLSQLKLPRKRLKIKNRKTVKIGIVNQQESICNDIEQASNNVQCPSISSQNVTGIGPSMTSDDKSNFVDTSHKGHKMTIDRNESTSHYNKPTKNKSENKYCKMEITCKKSAHKKLLLGKSRKCDSKSSALNTKYETGIPCKLRAESPVEAEPVLDSVCFTRKWEAMKLPIMRRLGVYFEENIPVFKKRVRHCISDLELSTIEKNRFHVNMPKRSASTSDLTLKVG